MLRIGEDENRDTCERKTPKHGREGDESRDEAYCKAARRPWQTRSLRNALSLSRKLEGRNSISAFFSVLGPMVASGRSETPWQGKESKGLIG